MLISSININDKKSANYSDKNELNKEEKSNTNSLFKQPNTETSQIQEFETNISVSSEESNQIEIFKKLETLKEIKMKSIDLQKIRSKLCTEYAVIENESKSLGEYQKELEYLIQEKMEQLEILKQIQQDIFNVEKTINESQIDKNKAVESLVRLYNDYTPLKNKLDELKDSVGLPKTNDMELEDIDSFMQKFEPFAEKQAKNSNEVLHPEINSIFNRQISLNEEENLPQKFVPSFPLSFFNNFAKQVNNKKEEEIKHKDNTTCLQLNEKNYFPKNSALEPDYPVSLYAQNFRPEANNILAQKLQSEILKQKQFQNNNVQQERPKIYQEQLQSISPSFRQQPPPMKSCLSCNQQIHRNAPICPLCKAKSRSRNPKKPKKGTTKSSSRSPPRQEQNI